MVVIVKIKKFIRGTPYPKHKAKNREAAHEWTEDIIKQTVYLDKIKNPCKMTIEFRLPRERFTVGSPYGTDLDNLAKRLLDGLEHTIFSELTRGDGWILEMTLSKKVASGPDDTGADITVEILKECTIDGRFLYFSHGSVITLDDLEKIIPLDRIGEVSLYGYKELNPIIMDDHTSISSIKHTGEETDIVRGILCFIDFEYEIALDEAQRHFVNSGGGQQKREDVIVFDADGFPFKARTHVACG